MNEWQKEFPILKKIKSPKKLLINILLNLQKWGRRILFISILILLIYILYFILRDYFLSGINPTIPYKRDDINWNLVNTWKACRNLLLVFLIFIDLPLSLAVEIIYGIKKNYAKLLKIILNGFILWLFLIFSYTLAIFISDIVALINHIISIAFQMQF